MTVYVAESSRTIAAGLLKLKDAMIADYAEFMPPKDEVRKKILNEYVEDFIISYSKKYIKITEERGAVRAFIVNVDNDPKFKKGDILMPIAYNKPVRDTARGNILDGGYEIKWSGAMYI